MALKIFIPAPHPIADKTNNEIVTRPWLLFFQQLVKTLFSGLTGAVTAGSDGVTTITNNAVTVAKLQQVPTKTLLGRLTAGTGNVEVLTIGTGFTEVGTTLNAGGTAYVPVSTGAEPLLIMSNGAGSVLLTPFTP